MRKLLYIVIFLCVSGAVHAQVEGRNEVVKWVSWAALQGIPSFTYFEDNGNNDNRLQFGLRWHVVPVNYSFNANKLVSPVQFFHVNPVRRFGGSLELFAQPEWAMKDYRNTNLKRFQYSTGVRAFIPAVESGEYLAFSIGGKYSVRESKAGMDNNTSALELGAYSFYGILGIQFNYNFNTASRYNIGLYIKYY